MDPTKLLDEFRAEANEHLAALDAALLNLERDPRDPRPVRELFLSAHTIKGSAAMLGLEGVRALAHAMEDVLAALRDGRLSLDAQTADLLFRVVDAGLIDGLAVNGPARGVRALASNGLKYLQTGFTQSYIFLMIVGAAAIVGYLLR